MAGSVKVPEGRSKAQEEVEEIKAVENEGR